MSFERQNDTRRFVNVVDTLQSLPVTDVLDAVTKALTSDQLRKVVTLGVAAAYKHSEWSDVVNSLYQYIYPSLDKNYQLLSTTNKMKEYVWPRVMSTDQATCTFMDVFSQNCGAKIFQYLGFRDSARCCGTTKHFLFAFNQKSSVIEVSASDLNRIADCTNNQNQYYHYRLSNPASFSRVRCIRFDRALTVRIAELLRELKFLDTICVEDEFLGVLDMFGIMTEGLFAPVKSMVKKLSIDAGETDPEKPLESIARMESITAGISSFPNIKFVDFILGKKRTMKIVNDLPTLAKWLHHENLLFSRLSVYEAAGIEVKKFVSCHHKCHVGSLVRARLWQNTSLDLSQSKKLQETFQILSDWYESGDIEASIVFSVPFVTSAWIGSGNCLIRDDVKNDPFNKAKWIELLFKAATYYFVNKKLNRNENDYQYPYRNEKGKMEKCHIRNINSRVYFKPMADEIKQILSVEVGFDCSEKQHALQ